MKEPLVSILIPVYNREKIVSRAIDSALAQTYRNIEIIVCDNASTDNTWDVLQRYAKQDERVKAFRNETNVGPVRNWKECLKHASGKYGKFLWSDDEIVPSFTQTMVDAMENNPRCGFAYSSVEIRLKNQILPNEYELPKSGYYDSKIYVEGACMGTYSMPVSPGCALFKLSTLNRHLLVDIPNEENLNFSRYGAGNDQLLFLFACEEYDEMYYDEKALSIFYGEADSITMITPLVRYYTIAIFYFLKRTKRFKDIRNLYYKGKLFHQVDYYLVPYYRQRRIIYKIHKKFRKLFFVLLTNS